MIQEIADHYWERHIFAMSRTDLEKIFTYSLKKIQVIIDTAIDDTWGFYFSDLEKDIEITFTVEVQNTHYYDFGDLDFSSFENKVHESKSEKEIKSLKLSFIIVDNNEPLSFSRQYGKEWRVNYVVLKEERVIIFKNYLEEVF